MQLYAQPQNIQPTNCLNQHRYVITSGSPIDFHQDRTVLANGNLDVSNPHVKPDCRQGGDCDVLATLLHDLWKTARKRVPHFHEVRAADYPFVGNSYYHAASVLSHHFHADFKPYDVLLHQDLCVV